MLSQLNIVGKQISPLAIRLKNHCQIKEGSNMVYSGQFYNFQVKNLFKCIVVLMDSAYLPQDFLLYDMPRAGTPLL